MIAAAFLLVVFGLVTVFLYHRLAVATALPRSARYAIAGALVLGLAAALAALATMRGALSARTWQPVAVVGFTWMGVVYYLAQLLALVACGSLGYRFVRRRRGGRAPRNVRALRIATAVATAGAVAIAGYGLTEAHTARVHEVEVQVPTLPASFAGLRIALVTDVHVGPVRDGGFTRRVVAQVNAARPDLVVLAGDMIDGRIADIGSYTDALGDLRAPLGVVGVSGNHEVYSPDRRAWLERWESLGVRIVDNRHLTVRRGNQSIIVAGLSDHSTTGPDAPDAEAALRGTRPEDFILLVAHQPRQARAVTGAGYGVDLQVSGHTHGGQLWPNRYLVRLQQPMIDGYAVVDGVPVYTSRGAGAWGPAMRVGAPPEIPILVLHRG